MATADLNQLVKLPRFDFIAEFLVSVTRSKAARALVHGQQVRRRGKRYQIVQTGVVGHPRGLVTYQTTDTSLLFDVARRGHLGYFTREADNLRVDALTPRTPRT